jgi:hypothetical protein
VTSLSKRNERLLAASTHPVGSGACESSVTNSCASTHGSERGSGAGAAAFRRPREEIEDEDKAGSGRAHSWGGEGTVRERPGRGWRGAGCGQHGHGHGQAARGRSRSIGRPVGRNEAGRWCACAPGARGRR